MQITLDQALAGYNCNQLGVEQDGVKDYLVYQEDSGWSVQEYNLFWRILRCLLPCFFKHTQLSHVIGKLEEESEALPNDLKMHLKTLWEKTYPEATLPNVFKQNQQADSPFQNDGYWSGTACSTLSAQAVPGATTLQASEAKGLIVNGDCEESSTFNGKIEVEDRKTGYLGADKVFGFKEHIRDSNKRSFKDFRPYMESDLDYFYLPVSFIDKSGNAANITLPNGTPLNYLPSWIFTLRRSSGRLEFYWDDMKFILETNWGNLRKDAFVPNQQYLFAEDQDQICFKGQRLNPRSATIQSLAYFLGVSVLGKDNKLWTEEPRGTYTLKKEENAKITCSNAKITCSMDSEIKSEDVQIVFYTKEGILVIQSKNSRGEIQRGIIHDKSLRAVNLHAPTTKFKFNHGLLTIDYDPYIESPMMHMWGTDSLTPNFLPKNV